MNLQGLEVGQRFKNYRALCEHLGQPIKGGASKIAQKKEWAQYFDHEKYMGNDLIITKIHDAPQWTNDRNLQVAAVEFLLTYELSQHENHTATFTRTALYHLLGLVNSNYYNLKNKDSEIKELLPAATTWEVVQYHRSVATLWKFVKSALEKLEKKSLLNHSSVYAIHEWFNGKPQGHRTSSKQEIAVIQHIERLVLKDMYEEGLIKELKKPFHLMTQFYSRVNAKINERFLQDYESGVMITRIEWLLYPEILLIFNQGDMMDALPEAQNNLRKKLAEYRQVLNEKSLSLILSHFQKAFDKNSEDYIEAFAKLPPLKIGERRFDLQSREKITGFFNYPNSFLENGAKFAELFVKLPESGTNERGDAVG